jgi:predicted permease
MPDWIRYVREHLRLAGVKSDRKEKIIRELAGQMEEMYLEALDAESSEDEALRQAERQIGDWELLSAELGRAERPTQTDAAGQRIERFEEEMRLKGKGWPVVADIWQDLRYGLRMLRKNPGFTAVAVFSLALAIGLNSTIFCLVDRIILQPLQVDHPRELALIKIRTEKRGLTTSLPYPEYLALRNQSKALSGIVGTQRHAAVLSGGEAMELVPSEYVTRNYFSVLGVRAHAGRFFRDDDRDAAQPVVVISYGLWQRHFGGDPGIVGKAVELTKRNVTVIGIAPQGFGGIQRPAATTDVWYPAEGSGAILSGPRAEEFDLMGRVAAGVPLEAAQAEVDTIVRRLVPSNPAAEKILGASVTLEAEDYSRRFVRLGFLVMVITGLILLIACVNVSNLLLARSQARRKELAIRLALGGSRLRLTRQLLTESLVLSLAGALFGLLLTRWATRALPALLPPMPMRVFPEISPDWRVVGFAIALAFLTTLVFALIPALHASRLDLVSLLGESPGTGQGGRRYIGRSALVVAQLCISLVLLTESGLLMKSFVRSLQADVGFEKKNMLLAQFALGIYEYDETKARSFFQTLQERVEALPGVKQVSLARRFPLSLFGGGVGQQVFFPGEQAPQNIKFNTVGPNYFQIMGTRILRGRDFTSLEFGSNAKVVLVSEAFARRFWPKEDALGQVIHFGDPSKADSSTIIGVVQDGPVNRIGEAPQPYMYLPLVRGFGAELTMLVETTGDPGALAGAFRQTARTIDKSVSPLLMSTLQDTLRQGLYDREMMVTFMGSFGLLGLMLASFGLYGIVSYTFSQRTREIGVRMALGAQPRDALRMVLQHGLRLALLGTAIGIPIALAVSYSLSSALYHVSPADPTALAGTALLLVAVALLASYIPARRATKVDPMVALRHQ